MNDDEWRAFIRQLESERIPIPPSRYRVIRPALDAKPETPAEKRKREEKP